MCEAHAQGLIHRDLKPANIFVGTLGSSHDHVKVLDFGLARPVERAAEAPGISRTDELLGTPAYMAPELIRGSGRIVTRADIYAIGCVAYFLLSGEMVFDAESSSATAIAHVSDEPVPPSRRGAEVPADLERVVLRCIAKDPDGRYQSCHQLIAALRECDQHGNWADDDASAWWRANGAKPQAFPDQVLASTAVP
jgi:serine/threonine-protein kinase